MILYRLAKFMERHTQLKQTIQSGSGDLSELRQQKEQVEQDLWNQASFWMQEKGFGDEAVSLLPAYAAEQAALENEASV